MSRRVVQTPRRPPRTPGPRGRGRGVPEGGRSTCSTAWRRRQPRRRQRAEQQTHTTNTRPRGSPHFVEAGCLGPLGAQPWALPTCPRASALVVWVVHQPLTQSWSSTKTRPRRQDVSAGHPQDVCCVERGRAGQRGWRRGTRGRSVKPLWAPTRFKWHFGPSQTRCVPPPRAPFDPVRSERRPSGVQSLRMVSGRELLLGLWRPPLALFFTVFTWRSVESFARVSCRSLFLYSYYVT